MVLHRNCNSLEGRLNKWALRSGIPRKEFLRNVANYWGIEFDNPTHLLITAKTLTTLGFDGLSYDSRVDGGTIKRPRGGRFVLEFDVLNKRAVKRRGKVAPVFAFTNQIVEAFDAKAALLIDGLIDAFTSDEEDED